MFDRAGVPGVHRRDAWWPLATHSLGEDRAQSVVFEGRPGGRVYERMRGGEEADWAKVLTWEPPERFVLAWQPNPEAPTPTELEVRFTAESDRSTRVDLEHRGWERLGDIAAAARASYDADWPGVVELYLRAADREAANS